MHQYRALRTDADGEGLGEVTVEQSDLLCSKKRSKSEFQQLMCFVFKCLWNRFGS